MKKGLFILLTILISGCSEYIEPQASDIAVFERFLSEKPNPTDDVNIASIYKEGDALFSPVLSIQRQKLAEAEEELKPLVEKGDPEAMFWMAKIIYRSSIKDTPKALSLLKESAKTNPYAAMALFPDNDQCQMYFPRECNEKWVEQAKILFSEDAKKGDVRATFYSKMLKEDHDVYVDAIIEAAKVHYYYPLVDYSNYILNDKSSNVEMKNLALSLLNYARVNNFIPAIDSLIHFYENNEMDKGNDYIELIKQGVLYGSNYAWNMNETLFRINDKNSNMDKYIKGKALYDFNGRDIGLSFVKFINNKELALANKKAQEMVDAVEDVIYIDGAHPRQD
ncbi:hypothetical protein HWA77_21245 [Photobacterium damselae subsp. damselae]|uniref:Sel1 repeat family protein n=1 Tax=Photobacterium damselae subsp. damselae TaxID=85581 RepID=A0A850R1N0_PHODD|nr:hypothetical protein [Photobacterium damselae subsp. damselae]